MSKTDKKMLQCYTYNRNIKNYCYANCNTYKPLKYKHSEQNFIHLHGCYTFFQNPFYIKYYTWLISWILGFTWRGAHKCLKQAIPRHVYEIFDCDEDLYWNPYKSSCWQFYLVTFPRIQDKNLLLVCRQYITKFICS